jgi:ribonuclease E
MEQRYAFKIVLEPNDKFLGAEYKVERTIKKTQEDKVKDITDITETPSEGFGHPDVEATKEEDPDSSTPKPRQRKRQANRRKSTIGTEDNPAEEKEMVSSERSNDNPLTNDADEDDGTRRRRRRGKRGGRRRTRKITDTEAPKQEELVDSSSSSLINSAEAVISSENIENNNEVKIESTDNSSTQSTIKKGKTDPKPKRRPRKKLEDQTAVEENIDKPARRRRKPTSEKINSPKATDDSKERTALAQNESTPEETNNKATETATPRRGWWNRLIQ